MKQSVKITEVESFFKAKEEAGGLSIETTSNGVFHVKVADGSIKAGEKVKVVLPVLQTVGEGRRVNQVCVGYVSEMMEIKGLGKGYFEKGVKLQNAYFE